MSHVRILVLPLTARKWFYYALPLENAAQQAAQAASSAASTSGRSLEDRIADLGSRLSNAARYQPHAPYSFHMSRETWWRCCTRWRGCLSASDCLPWQWQVHSLLLRQWRGLETAKPGTLKARIYRRGPLQAAPDETSANLHSL